LPREARSSRTFNRANRSKGAKKTAKKQNTRGGSHEQHVKAVEQSHKNTSSGLEGALHPGKAQGYFENDARHRDKKELCRK
jgi:hypothetical protein